MASLLFKHIFTILHIITAAAWFGMGLRLAAQARTVVSLDRNAGLALAKDTLRTVRFMNIFIVLTFIFAFATLMLGMSTVSYGMQYHMASLLIVILVVIQFALIRPAWTRLHGALETSEAEVGGYQKRIAMATGLGHLIWLFLLVLMFWDKLRTAL